MIKHIKKLYHYLNGTKPEISAPLKASNEEVKAVGDKVKKKYKKAIKNRKDK